MAGRPPISPDGLWYWDGAAWRSLVSADGGFVWTGQAWSPRYPTPAPAARRGPGLVGWALIGGGAVATLIAVVITGVLLALLFPEPAAAGTAAAAPASGAAIPCDAVEHLTGHYHVHLAIVAAGLPQKVPGQIGIEQACIRWLHTHDSSGLVHLEIPASQLGRTFYLGDFFGVWGQPLDGSQVAAWPGDVVAWVQSPGESRAYQWQGDVRALALDGCDAITLDVGGATPPPAYTFPRGFGCDGGAHPPAVSG